MKKQAFQNCNDVLVAIMKDKTDFVKLHNELWYRIPISSAPSNIKSGDAKILAFYQTSIFKEDKWQIKWYGRIKKQTEVTRQNLFPTESLKSKKAHVKYYKLELESLHALPKPIPCRLQRKINFIQTTLTKFMSAIEINYLFNDSPLEDMFFDALNKECIPNERQYEVKVNDKNRYLDFAVFCNVNNIAIECDGNTYHDTTEQVHKDKERDNELKGRGWSVMRFTTTMIQNNIEKSMLDLKNAINSQGGLKMLNEEPVRYMRTTSQLGLFD